MMITERATERSKLTSSGHHHPLTSEVQAQDRALRGVLRLGVRVDRALGQALTVLRKKKLFRPLGFVRIADYAREVVGLGQRSVQEMIRTEESLGKLPLIGFFWEAGMLQAEQVRLLCRVATPFTEQEWLTRAKGLSVRELSAVIKRQMETARESQEVRDFGLPVAHQGPCWATGGELGRDGQSDDTSDGESGGQHNGGSDGQSNDTRNGHTDDESNDKSNGEAGEFEPTERVSFAAPVPLAVRWRQTLRFSAAVSGADLPDWALVENICAEFLSGCPLPEKEPSEGWQASEQGGLAAGEDEGRQRRFGRERLVDFSDDGLPPEAADPQPEANLRSPWIPDSLEASLKRQPPSDPWALHERIVQLASLRSRLESQISQRLFRFVLDGGPQQAGYRGLPGYAREVLGMGERRARYLVSLERKLLGAGRVREEYRRGRLSWLQSLLILKVVQGERSEAGWVDYAQKVSVLRLRRAVEDARAAAEWTCLPPPIVGGEEEAGRQESAPVAGPVAGLGRQRPAPPDEVADVDGLDGDPVAPGSSAEKTAWRAPAPVDGVGDAELYWQLSAPATDRGRMSRVSFMAPREIAELWNRTMQEVRRVHGRPLRDWEAVEKLLDSFMETWDVQRAGRLRREQRIMRRDRWCCTVPAAPRCRTFMSTTCGSVRAEEAMRSGTSPRCALPIIFMECIRGAGSSSRAGRRRG